MSPEASLLALLPATALVGLALWRTRKLSALLQQAEAALQRAEVSGRDQAARLAALQSLQDAQQLAEHSIATGTAVVREMHKGIADIPFSVLEAIPGARAPAKALRGLHDAISDGVYSAIGNLNKAVGRELRKGVPMAPLPPLDAAPELPAIEQAASVPAQKPEALEAPEPDSDVAPANKPSPWG